MKLSQNLLKLIILFFYILCSSQVCGELVYSYNNKVKGEIAQKEDRQLYLYSVRYQSPAFMVEQLKITYPEGRFFCYENNAMIGIQTIPSRYKDIDAFLCKLDFPVDQVRIEVEVIEINSDDLEEYGMKWDMEKSVAIDNNMVLLSEQGLLSRIKLARQRGKARLKANPSLVVKNNCTALISIGDKVPVATPEKEKGYYSISYLDAGIRLKIVPGIISGNFVETLVQPEVSTIKGWKSTPGGEYPVISSKEAETRIKVVSGEQFMIAGLRSNSEQQYRFEVPILSAIPLIGNLFIFSSGQVEETEIIFCIRPTIIKS